MNRGNYVAKAVLILLLGVLLASCGGDEKKSENMTGRTDTTGVNDTVADTADTTSGDNESAAKKQEESYPDITGSWEGTFDGRPFTLNITSQNENSFTGSTRIVTRNVRNNSVKGTFDRETGSVEMNDQERSRYKGTFRGKFNGDFNKLSGTFTYHTDNQKVNFTLSK